MNAFCRLLVLLLSVALPLAASASSFTTTFGGSPVTPSQVAYASYSFSSSTALFWPQFAAGQTNVAATFMNITTTSGGLNVLMPDATLQSTGYATIIFNAGSYSFNVTTYSGSAIVTIAPGQTYYIIETGNSTQSGTWKTVQFGVGTGSANASALAGAGLQAMAGLLQLNLNANNVSSGFTITASNLAQLYVWTGGSGTINVPTAASVGNGFFFEVANNGSGNLTITPAGGTIDGGVSSVFAQSQSGFIMSNGTNWFTVGKGIQNTFSVTLLNLNVAGSSNITETSTQAQNIIQVFTGVLTGNINVIVPATVQLYEVNNSSTGSYTITVKTSGGTGIVVPQGNTSILYCDGTNVVNGFTASVTSSISLANGSAASPSLSFSSSPSTGLYSPNSNQAALSTNGYETLLLSSTASAVDYLNINASSTTNPVTISAAGTDTNIGITLTPKGSGTVTLGTLDGTMIGTNTPSSGAFTTLSASSTVSGTGFSTYLASPPAIGGTAAAAGSFTTLAASGNTTLSGTLSAIAVNNEGFETTGDNIGRDVFSGKSSLGVLTGYYGTAAMIQGGNASLSSTPQLDIQPYGGAVAIGSSNPVVISSLGVVNIPGLTASELVSTDGSKNLTNVTALPSGTTATTQSARDASTKVATTAYADNASHFGSWTYNGYTAGTAYLAATDGIVTAYVGSSGATAEVLSGLTDGSNPPVTTVISNEGAVPSGGTQYASITFPVRKGDYWKVTVNANTPVINWLPMGN